VSQEAAAEGGTVERAEPDVTEHSKPARRERLKTGHPGAGAGVWVNAAGDATALAWAVELMTEGGCASLWERWAEPPC
jgi:hypothetical protein